MLQQHTPKTIVISHSPAHYPCNSIISNADHHFLVIVVNELTLYNITGVGVH